MQFYFVSDNEYFEYYHLWILLIITWNTYLYVFKYNYNIGSVTSNKYNL